MKISARSVLVVLFFFSIIFRGETIAGDWKLVVYFILWHVP